MGAANGPALLSEPDVPIAADERVARPLVAGHGEKAPGFVELGGEAVELGPEFIRDLEVVPLVARDIEERLVTGELEVAPRGIGADGLFRLAVQIAPVVPSAVVRRCDPKRIGRAKKLARLVEEFDGEVGLRRDGKVVENEAERPVDELRPIRKSGDRRRRTELHGLLEPVARIAPDVLALDVQAERLADASQGREHGHPPIAGSWADRDRRQVRELEELLGRERVHQRPELEPVLAVGLETETRASPAPVPEHHGDLVAGGEPALHEARLEGVEPGPLVEERRPDDLEGPPGRRPAGDVAGRGRVAGLRCRVVLRPMEDEAHRAPVVHAERADPHGHDEGLVRRDFERSDRRRDGERSELFLAESALHDGVGSSEFKFSPPPRAGATAGEAQ